MGISTGYGQCTVFDLPDSTQNKIVKAHTDLKACQAQQKVDSTEIEQLRLDKVQLNDDLNNAAGEITGLQQAAIKRKKWPWITGVIGFAAGIYAGSRIR